MRPLCQIFVGQGGLELLVHCQSDVMQLRSKANGNTLWLELKVVLLPQLAAPDRFASDSGQTYQMRTIVANFSTYETTVKGVDSRQRASISPKQLETLGDK